MTGSGDRPPRSVFRLFRIDDRLLHGQVSLGWGRYLCPSAYLIADDRIAADPQAAELYRFAAPEGEEVRVRAIADVVADSLDPASAAETVLLVRDLAGASRLLWAGVPGPVNLGGLHHRPGARELLPYLHLTPEDEALLRKLAAEGTEFFAQDLPDNRRWALPEILP